MPKLQPLFVPIAATTLGLFGIAMAVPGLRDILQLGLPSPAQLAVVAAVGLLVWTLLELLKLAPSVRRTTGAMRAS